MKSKAFRTNSAAFKYARENGIDIVLKAGDFYIVQETSSLTEMAVLEHHTNRLGNESWQYAGHVNRGHLTRLGNANHAVAKTR